MYKYFDRIKKVLLSVTLIMLLCIPISVSGQNLMHDISGGDALGSDVSDGDALGNDTSGNRIVNANELPPDVISVVIPTEFNFVILIDSEDGGYIQGEDIIIVNKSEFPVCMRINSMTCEVSRESTEEGEKEVQLFMRLKQYDQSDIVLPIPEEGRGEALEIKLEKSSQSMDESQLLLEEEISNSIEPVLLEDCIALCPEGTVGPGHWKSGDVKIHITYEFERIEEEDVWEENP